MANNEIGSSKPVVGGYSTAFNTQKGQGAHNPLGDKGNANPGNTKPPRPADVRTPLNATGKK